MKKFILTLLPVMVFCCFVSCSKNEKENEYNLKQETSQTVERIDLDTIPVFHSDEEIFSFFMQNSKESNVKKKSNIVIPTRAIISDPITVYGYTSATLQSTSLASYPGNSTYGVPPGLYVLDYYELTKAVTLPVGAVPITMSSPNCGHHPVLGAQSRGYVSYADNNTLYMLTKAVLIRTTSAGTAVNVWLPMYNASNTEWVYAYAIL